MDRSEGAGNVDERRNLDGDVAIVTGAGRNIGQEIAETFAAAGARVVVVDLDEDRAESTVRSIREGGSEAVSVVTDVAEKRAVDEVVTVVRETYGSADVLVNNAGVMDRTPFFDLTVEEFDRVIDVILRGTFLCTRATVPLMKESGGGRIVNVGSTLAHRGRAESPAYTTAKSGILNFTRSAARALAEDDITVNVLSPMQAGTLTLTPGQLAEENGPKESEERKTDADEVPLGRTCTPADIASVALFLVSEESDFVTGTEIIVDGGYLS